MAKLLHQTGRETQAAIHVKGFAGHCVGQAADGVGAGAGQAGRIGTFGHGEGQILQWRGDGRDGTAINPPGLGEQIDLHHCRKGFGNSLLHRMIVIRIAV